MLSKTSKYTFESTIDDVSTTCGNDCSVLLLCVALKRSIKQTQIRRQQEQELMNHGQVLQRLM